MSSQISPNKTKNRFSVAQMHVNLSMIKTHQRANLAGAHTCGTRVVSKARDKCLFSSVLAPFTPRSHVQVNHSCQYGSSLIKVQGFNRSF